MTEWVLSALVSEAEQQKALWVDGSWNTGEANQSALTELRAKAAALLAINDANYEGLCDIHGQDPIAD